MVESLILVGFLFTLYKLVDKKQTNLYNDILFPFLGRNVFDSEMDNLKEEFRWMQGKNA